MGVTVLVAVGLAFVVAGVLLAWWSALYPLGIGLAFLASICAGIVGIAMALSLRLLGVGRWPVVVATVLAVSALTTSFFLSRAESLAAGVVVDSRLELEGLCSRAVNMDDYEFAAEGRTTVGKLSVYGPAVRLPDDSCLVHVEPGFGTLEYPAVVLGEPTLGSNAAMVGGKFIAELAPGISLYAIPYSVVHD